MLEGLVAWVLNNYLGKYVENLNTDQLSIAILSGEVELENLPLRRDALRHLGIPIEIRAGHIGKVKLQVPIRSLRSSPWLLIMEGLYLVAAPLSLDDWDQSAEEFAEQERKLSSLDAIEACWRLESDGNVVNSSYASSYTSWLSYGTGVITDIVENMQLHVKDVHFRFENEISFSGNENEDFVCGLTIESLSAQSCDKNWQPQFTTHRDGSNLSFKNIELKNLAIYWDSIDRATELTSKLSPADLAAALANDSVDKHRYLVAPVSASAKLQRNRSEQPLKSVNTPRFVCDFSLDQVPLIIVHWQYEQMVCCLRGLDFLSRVQQYRRYRPTVPVKTDPKAWWWYACNCQIPGGLRRRISWSEALERARENVRYVELYNRWLAQPSAALGVESKRLKDHVEWTRDFEELKSLREVAMRRVSTDFSPLPVTSCTDNSSHGRSVLVQWFPQWWGWYSSPSTEDVITPPQAASPSSTKLEDEILEALADSARNNTLLRRDVVFGKFNFMLNGGSLQLRSYLETGVEGLTMLELQFSELEVGVILRPRSSAFGVELRLGSVQLFDRLTYETLFPVLVGPSTHHHQQHYFHGRLNKQPTETSPNTTDSAAPLFILKYESTSSPAVRRLHVTSRPLDVVYQPEAVRFLLDFICAPHQRSAARDRLHAMRCQLSDTWGSMLESSRGEQHRTASWDLHLHVSAPQIIVVENFRDSHAAIAVVDLGTLRLENQPHHTTKLHKEAVANLQKSPLNTTASAHSQDDDDDEMFMTPCSTPPGSEAGDDDTATLATAFSELSLHQRLYETYSIELADIQILVGRVRDNWRHAHTKGSSTLHVLDRFNISLQIERRIVPTSDPMYPSITLSAVLPSLVAHINEQKIAAVRTLARVITSTSLPSPFSDVEAPLEMVTTPASCSTLAEEDEDSTRQLVTLQFTVKHMSLEVQSRGRSVAELQVSGVTVSLTRRPLDISISLTVHGLLLVDALQTFGADFELLVASHRHVAMDSMSGSLRDSEPTSPTSPASPDPGATPRQHSAGGTTSPVALTQALSAVVSPVPPHHIVDAEALISVEFLVVNGSEENLQVATIQFNNLDIIANQETIVELVGFLRRVSPSPSRGVPVLIPQPSDDRPPSRSELSTDHSVSARTSRTELTFDFHRLSVLLVRAAGQTGRKIGTATMCEARIQATVDSSLYIRGSLGGLQVLNLTPEGYLHQRIISVGRDPLGLEENPVDFLPIDDETAFSFSILKNLQQEEDKGVEVSMKMASVWYIHSQQFLTELKSCATEFKQYLADVARSLKMAATDVALGLVHARAEQLQQHGIYSPRRLRRRTSSLSSTEPPTPLFTPGEEDGYESNVSFEDLRLDVVLDSPIVILPRSSTSCQVLIAHLGKITVNNHQNTDEFAVEVRHMNISTLDTTDKRIGNLDSGVPRVEQLYNCENALPILHDTLLQLKVTKSQPVEDTLELEDAPSGLLEVIGCVVNDLKVSLTRAQYEQLLETLQNNTTQTQQPSAHILPEIVEEDVLHLVGGVSTLSMDPHVRAKLFPSATRYHNTTSGSSMKISIRFEVATFDVELCGENGLVGLSFGEFLLVCTTPTSHETHVKVSLRSLLVEDLLRPKGSLGRQMIASRDEDNNLAMIPPCISHSCPPEASAYHPSHLTHFGSLPDRLDTKQIFGVVNIPIEKRPIARIPRPARGEDLVLVTSKIEAMKKTTTVELGTLDLTVSAKSWLPLLEFFSYVDDAQKQQQSDRIEENHEDNSSSSTVVSIRSLTLQALSKNDENLARARATGIHVDISRKSHRHRCIEGQLEVLHISDGDIQQACRGERFVTIGKRALDFKYICPSVNQDHEDPLADSELHLNISPFVYVHTKKFVAQLRAFFAEFSNSKSHTKRKINTVVSRMALNLSADACVMLLPVKIGSSDLLVLDVGRLTAQNIFVNTEENLFLDVTTWQLYQVDVYGAIAAERDILTMNTSRESALVFGDCIVVKRGRSLLAEKCLLEFTVDRNLMPNEYHRQTGVADMTINCRLSTLEVFLNLEDYTLIRGVLSHNLGEDTEYILPSVSATTVEDDVWTLTSMRIELLDVKVHLNSLACINFVRSRLTVDSFSDLSQDIDLVSRQILVIDERKQKTNVFDVVLRPSSRGSAGDGTVQAEIHSRRRIDKNKFTVLLNNMRVMAVADWWKLAGEFIFTNYQANDTKTLKNSPEIPFELKLNITESEIVVVEDTTNVDTNAVILQSTTLLMYKPNDDNFSESTKPLSCRINHLEVFSCRLSDEEATALSIVDPVTASIDIVSNVLDIQLQELTIRVSYRDVLMFAAILDSFRKQTASIPTKKTSIATKKLCDLGFSPDDCETALENCDYELDDAALWLTQNAAPTVENKSVLDYKLIEVHIACLRFCLIDDCGDVDVPLAEATLTNLAALFEEETTVESTLNLDYYNRVLGGWEPMIESWKYRGLWHPDQNLSSPRHRFVLNSDNILNINITDSLLSLVRLVSDSWSRNIPRLVPRSPFIPYSIRNETGSVLIFVTVITKPDEPVRSSSDFEGDEGLKWVEVLPGVTVPFSYSRQNKRRHQESHRLHAHQLVVRVKGWCACAPVTVDRVGVYFRPVLPQGVAITAPKPARLVFDVRLDGSARKLVVVRSAMLLVNRLPDDVDVKLVERSAVNAISTASRSAVLSAGEQLPLPLVHTHSHVFVRPSTNLEYSYSQPDVPYSRIQRLGERGLFTLRCITNRGPNYHICCEVRRERFPNTFAVGSNAPGHTILLLPVLLLVNLLPQDMHYTVTTSSSVVIARGSVPPGKSTSVPAANPDSSVEIAVHLDNFRCTTAVTIPNSSTPAEGEFTTRVRLEDTDRRRLNLRARVEFARGARVRITVTAPYWIVNRTGLPLVFRQAGSATGIGTAGQFEEHELARMVAPLLMSLADDEPPALVARVGNKYKPGTETHWCQQFHLRRGVQVRGLRVSQQNHSASDTVYVVGIEVRPAKGRRRHQHTNIVTVSPRHQLHNRTNYTLEFAQACHAGAHTETETAAFFVHAPPGCHVPFHWPRLDREQLLCIRCFPESGPATAWTGGLRIDAPISQHLIVRHAKTGVRYCFLHAEIIPHGAMHCLVVSEAEGLPPPLRIDNCSEVAVTFGQCGAGGLATVAHAHRAVPYAWDEPTGAKRLVLTVPGGVSATYDVDRLGRASQLTYENFIYVAFTATFRTEDDLDHYNEEDYSLMSPKRKLNKEPNIDSLQQQRLVLDVPDGTTTVILSRKQPGARSQLWRMTTTGQLQHEGSTATQMVLDLEAPAPQPSAAWPARLALRRPDPRRRSTQTWRFTADGRLCCVHRNTCVQALELRPGSVAVLGAAYGTSHTPPPSQAVGKQRMRPGSGLLAVEITTDGPTRVFCVTDMKQQQETSQIISSDEDWHGVALVHRPQKDAESNNLSGEIQVTLMFRAGLSISVIGNSRELLYLELNNIISEAIYGPKHRGLCLSVQDFQCDNQLFDSPAPVLLHAAKGRSSTTTSAQQLPVLELRAEMSPPAGEVVIFKHFIVCVRPLALHLEETLLLRLYEFLLSAIGEIVVIDDDYLENDEQIVTSAATLGPTPTLATITRYHFGIIRLVPSALRLSVYTASPSALTHRLRTLKRRLGLTLVGFEDAPVELEPYVRHHPVETGERLIQSVVDHFRDELLWQAAAILGSVDFLGNPLGLLGDVTEGVSGLIRERSVGALVLNVAHGLSNSAAKVTETLSDGLGRVTMDEAHEEMRQRLRRRQATSGLEHLAAGIKGLGFGMLGGATGIFKQVYEGASSDGLQGVFSGLGKGLVGAVAKPVVGVLDFATETARAVRDSSRSSARTIIERRRLPRATQGPGGLLPTYKIRDSIGQGYLRALCHSEHDSDATDSFSIEQFVAYECVKSGSDDLRVIVSSERIRVVTDSSTTSSLTVVMETGLGELVACTPITQPDGRHYIEMTVKGAQQMRRPLIRCDSEKLARDVTRQINYAKRLHEEATHTLRSHDD